MSRMRFPETLWSKVDKSYPNGCWLWTGQVNKRSGYSKIKIGGRWTSAHRAAYELLVGPIPDGLTIDHLCRVRRCVNPAHLQAVTSCENSLRGNSPPALNARKTHCQNGHEFNEANTYITVSGARCCRPCHQALKLAYRLADPASAREKQRESYRRRKGQII